MNCLNFGDKGLYLKYVNGLSDEEVVLQRKMTCNLLDEINNKYDEVKMNINTIIIPALKAISRKRNLTNANKAFKHVLKAFFEMECADNRYIKDLSKYSNSVRDDSDYTREESIEIVGKIYDELLDEYENGMCDKCLALINLIINHCAIIMYRLYNVALLDEKELEPYLAAPNELFGGLDENGEPDVKYAVKRLLDEAQFAIRFVENDF